MEEKYNIQELIDALKKVPSQELMGTFLMIMSYSIIVFVLFIWTFPLSLLFVLFFAGLFISKGKLENETFSEKCLRLLVNYMKTVK